MGKNIKILLIEDNPGDAYLIEEHLEEFANFSYELVIVETLGEALSVLTKKSFDVILLDLELPDSYGINTFLSIHNKNPFIPIIILTGLNDKTIGTYAIKPTFRRCSLKSHQFPGYRFSEVALFILAQVCRNILKSQNYLPSSRVWNLYF